MVSTNSFTLPCFISGILASTLSELLCNTPASPSPVKPLVAMPVVVGVSLVGVSASFETIPPPPSVPPLDCVLFFVLSVVVLCGTLGLVTCLSYSLPSPIISPSNPLRSDSAKLRTLSHVAARFSSGSLLNDKRSAIEYLSPYLGSAFSKRSHAFTHLS